MTITVGQPDLLQEIKRMDQRIYDLEQGRGGITYDSNGAPVFKRGMTIGDDDPIYVDEPVPPPTNLTLSWGSFYENIFITAEWTAPTGPGSSQVNQYEAELTEVGVGVIQSQVVGGNSARFNGLKPNQQYSVRVRSINRLSRSSSYTSPQTITTGTDATIPAQVQNVQAGAGQKTMTVWWDENTEEDVRFGHGGYECELSTSATFLTTFRTIRTTGTIVSFGDLVTGTTYYARVRAFDSSGNFGPFSLTVSATPGKAQGGDIENGAVCDDHVCASGISAAHIKFGTMEGDRIQTNTLDANRIKTSSLDAQTITIAGSGMFRIGRTSSPFHYMLQDSAGIRFYQNGSAAFTGGTLAVDLNVTTGGATFKGNIDASTITGSTITGGTIRTAASGQRIQMDNSNPDRVKFFTGNASEIANGYVLVDTHNDDGDRPRLVLQPGAFTSGDNCLFMIYGRTPSGTGEEHVLIQSGSSSANRGVVAITAGRALGIGQSNQQITFNSTGISTMPPFQTEIEMRLNKIWLNASAGSTSVYDLSGFGSVVASGGDAFIGGSGSNSSARMTGGRVKARNYGDTAFVDFEGANIAPSDSKIKKAIRDTTRTELFSAFGKTKTKRYRRITDPDTHPLRYGLIAEELDPDLQRPIVNRPMTQIEVPKEGGTGTYMKAEYGPEERLTGYNVDEVLAMLYGVVEYMRQDTVENRAKINQIISALPAVNRPAPLN